MQSTFSTIVAGVTVFVIGQVLVKLTIDPVQQLKAAISLTANTLLRHQAQITNATPNEEISAAVRSHAADLVSKVAMISFYPVTALLFGLPSKTNIMKAAQELNLIGYGMILAPQRTQESPELDIDKAHYAFHNSSAINEIARLLKIRTSYQDKQQW